MDQPGPTVTPRTLAFIGCRLLAVYLLYLLLPMLPSLTVVLGGPQTMTQWRGYQDWNPVAIIALSVSLILLLWSQAAWLAEKIIPAPGETAQNDPVTVDGFAAAAIAVAGLLLTVNAVTQLAYQAVSYVVRSRFYVIDNLTSTAVSLVIGVVLIFGARRIAQGLKRARNW